ncbi:MAG: hypothetical protein HZB76_02840 [Chlamydiae bacterium]|nr:hypothetical protein [Chlamydiota bacterium]
MKRCFITFIFLSFFALSFAEDLQEKKYYFPKIFQGIWPNFCFRHLSSNPEGCSSFYVNKNGEASLEFLAQGSAQAFIDKDLIDQIAPYIKYFPQYEGYSPCDYIYCKACRSAVMRRVVAVWEEWDDDDDDFEPEYYCELEYKCNCKNRWGEDKWGDRDYVYKEDYWESCHNSYINHYYFDWHSKFYFNFLLQHLEYCSENDNCNCYWPQLSEISCQISDAVYSQMSNNLENEEAFKGLIECIPPPKEFPTLRNRTSYGVILSLFTHAFFYSQYRQIIIDLCKYCDSNNDMPLDKLYHILDLIQPLYINLYSKCLTSHFHPKILYERGMVYMHRGETYEALLDIKKFIEYMEDNHLDDLLTSDLYLQEGTTYSEIGQYDKALSALSKAILKDSQNKEAYFERAFIYFEQQKFDQSVSDFLNSDYKITPFSTNPKFSMEFVKALTSGILKGGRESLKEFVPSMLGTMSGIANGLWAFALDPKNVSMEMLDSTTQMIKFVKDNTSSELIQILVPELKELVNKWDKLSDKKKGELTGYVIGKYGIDIFLCKEVSSSLKYYQDLKQANQALTLQCLTDPKIKQAVLDQSVKIKKARETILKNDNLKIEWDKQGKHIQGHKNFNPSKEKSILTHKDPQRLVNDYAGSGIKIRGDYPGAAGYQEVVDFGEVIGYAVERETEEHIITTWGKIHYSKNGVHIVPTKPREGL